MFVSAVIFIGFKCFFPKRRLRRVFLPLHRQCGGKLFCAAKTKFAAQNTTCHLLMQIKPVGFDGLFDNRNGCLSSLFPFAKTNRDFMLPIIRQLANSGSYQPTGAKRKIAMIFMFSLQKILMKEDFKMNKIIFILTDKF